MEIVYKDTQELDKNDLERLFLSVEWSSGHYPEKLAAAMRNFKTVYTAWDGAHLVGLICAMDDGVMTAYIHYLLVDPAYHHRGIGTRLVGMMKEKYRDYLRIALIAYQDETDFYRSCGFQPAESAVPMFITELWT